MAIQYIEAYVHLNKVGGMVAIESADHFAVRTEEFRELARGLAMHVASTDLDPFEGYRDLGVVAAVTAREAAQLSERALLKQPYFKDPTKTVGEIVAEVDRQLRAKIRIVKYVRFEA